MRYLVTLPPVVLPGGNTDAQPTAGGLPVVPWFPAPLRQSFLAIGPWQLVDFAVVADVDIDPDALAQSLFEQYPGLPKVLHDNYVLATALAAAQLPLGARVRPIIDYDEAQVQVVDKATLITLWHEQPTKAPL